MHYLIRDLNQNEKPREKIAKLGQANLTDTELLALLLRSGGKEISAIELARQILARFNGLNGLANTDIQQLTQIKFVDIAKASEIMAAIEIGLRITSDSQKYQEKAIQKPQDVVNIMKKELFGKQKEFLFLLSLNSRNRLIAKDLITVGTINETLLSPREIFRQALTRNAVAIILTHNHPSNDAAPSSEDIEISQKIVSISKQIGIPLLDHIIVSDNSYTSMKSLGLLIKGGEKK